MFADLRTQIGRQLPEELAEQLDEKLDAKLANLKIALTGQRAPLGEVQRAIEGLEVLAVAEQERNAQVAAGGAASSNRGAGISAGPTWWRPNCG